MPTTSPILLDYFEITMRKFTKGGHNPRYGYVSDLLWGSDPYERRKNDLRYPAGVVFRPDGFWTEEGDTVSIVDFYLEDKGFDHYTIGGQPWEGGPTPSNCEIVLKVNKYVENAGWEEIIVGHTDLTLRRQQARFNRTSAGGGFTTWTWTGIAREDYLQFFHNYERNVNTVTFVESIEFPGTPGYQHRFDYVRFYFVNEQIEQQNTFSQQMAPLYVGAVNETVFKTTPYVSSGEVLPVGYHITGTQIRGNYPSTFQNQNFENIGPILSGHKDCRTYVSVEEPRDVSQTDGIFNVQVTGYIHGSSQPTPDTVSAWKSALLGNKIRSKCGHFKGTITNAIYAGIGSTVEVMDIDLDGEKDALTDGLLFLRYLFGLRGAALANNAVSDGAARSVDQIEEFLERSDVQAYLDFDENGTLDALTDGIMMLRYLFGLRNQVLTENAIASDSPYYPDDWEAVSANVEEAYTATVVDNNVASGDIDIASGTTLISYSLDSDSLLAAPPLMSDLFVELQNGMEMHNIKQTGYTGGSSAWSIDRYGNNFATAYQISTERESTSYRAFENLGRPMILIEPDLGAQAQGQVLEPGYSVNQAILFDNYNTNGDYLNINTSGFTGPTHTVTMQTVKNSGLMESTQQAETIIREQNLDFVNSTLLVEIKMPIVATQGNFPEDVDIQLTNCTILKQSDLYQGMNSSGATKFIIVPNSAGERYQVRIQYFFGPSRTNLVGKTFIVQGKVKGKPQKHVEVFQNFDTSNSATTESTTGIKLYGTDGLQLSHTLLTNLSEDDAQYFRGRMVTGSSGNLSGGVLINLDGPVKAPSARVNYNDQIDLVWDAPIFIPDGTSDTWSASTSFVIDDPEFRIPWHGTQTRNKVFTCHRSGTWQPDMGLEATSALGGTRLDSSTQPLRYITRVSGTQVASNTVSNIIENTSAALSDDYASDQPTQAWIDTGSRRIGRSWHEIQVWFNGIEVTAGNRPTYFGNFGEGPTRVEVGDIDYFRGVAQNSTSVTDYRQVSSRFTAQYHTITYPSPVRIDINEPHNSENSFTLGITNNSNESMVQVNNDYGQQDLFLYPSTWHAFEPYNMYGDEEDHVNQNYTIQVFKVK